MKQRDPTKRAEQEAAGAPAPRRRRRNELLIVGGVLSGLALGLLIAGWDLIWGGAPDVTNSPIANAPAQSRMATGNPASANEKVLAEDAEGNVASQLIDDDGKTMWASPTAGRPLTLEFLPPGVQMVVALRPSALVGHPEGEKALAALGPLGDEGIRSIESIWGMPFGEMERLVIGWQVVGGELAANLVVYGGSLAIKDEPSPSPSLRGRGNLNAAWSYFRPERAGGPLLVAGSAESIDEIKQLGGQAPPLRREVEKLLALTDADRHLTLVVAPGVLFGEGRDLFAGPLAKLREALFSFLGDELTATVVSIHWDENFFAEVLATPTLDAPAGQVAGRLADRVAEFPDLVEAHVLDLNAGPHGRRIIARFPTMARKLATYSRIGFERDHVMLRCYLPAVAGHNLLMGAELALAEGGGGIRPPAEAGSPVGENSLASDAIEAKLARRITLRMPRDTLEAALAQLARELGVEIVIVGADLQADGITKNQSLDVNLEELPGAEVLVEILRRANPDKSAAGPGDARQKLVYVVGPKGPGGPAVIFVTTRSRAAERGEKLPDVFTSQQQGAGRRRKSGTVPVVRFFRFRALFSLLSAFWRRGMMEAIYCPRLGELCEAIVIRPAAEAASPTVSNRCILWNHSLLSVKLAARG